MVAVAAQPQITPVDRFGLTLCLAIIVHGILILGVTFAPEDILKPQFETMEIILVQQESPEPDQAEYLAQANLEGGADNTESIKPSTPQPAPFPDETPDITAPPQIEPQPPQETSPPVTETEITDSEPLPPEMAVESSTAEEAITETTETEITDTKPETDSEQEPEPEQAGEVEAVAEQVETPPLPSATALLTNSFKIASLSAEVRKKLEAKAKRPKRKFISASTKEYKYAAYMEAWRAKVERVGNLNYPAAARQHKLSGSLILDVALNADGSVNQITVRRSSGTRILDDAAIRIVELASPFAPFPDHIKSETDILHITRTWQFLNNNRFR